jgi:hypothetical protein
VLPRYRRIGRAAQDPARPMRKIAGTIRRLAPDLLGRRRWNSCVSQGRSFEKELIRGGLRLSPSELKHCPPCAAAAPPARRVPASRAAEPYPNPQAKCPQLRETVNFDEQKSKKIYSSVRETKPQRIGCQCRREASVCNWPCRASLIAHPRRRGRRTAGRRRNVRRRGRVLPHRCRWGRRTASRRRRNVRPRGRLSHGCRRGRTSGRWWRGRSHGYRRWRSVSRRHGNLISLGVHALHIRNVVEALQRPLSARDLIGTRG